MSRDAQIPPVMEDKLPTPRRPAPSLSLKTHTLPRIVHEDLPLLSAIVSGGQTGVDTAGLRVGRSLGLKTGGFAALGWRTLDGPMPSLGTDFGLTETGVADYAHRTAKNVFAADATIRIASDFCSPGERCTLKAIDRYKKPFLDIIIKQDEHGIFISGAYEHAHNYFISNADLELRYFLVRHNVKILNIAGNSEQTYPGIGKLAYDFLLSALRSA